MKDSIIKTVDEEWLANIKDKVMGFTNKTPIEMLDHLETKGWTLDCVDTNEIMKYRYAPWDTTEHVVAYFHHVKKAVKKMNRANITSNKIELLYQALYTFKESRYLEKALVNWNSPPELYQTW